MTVKDLRKERGLTQTAIAEQLGIEQPYYSRIERGQANPTLDKTMELARVLNVGIGTLVEELARARQAVLATLGGPSSDGDSPGYLHRFGVVCRLPTVRVMPTRILLPAAA